ncbi:MAG: DUF1972 domain-containing protein [Crocinitomicaceae bacterium]|nr:DUF1972 domain-containing protein [Crocinitomicaceae bacterium]
MSKKVAIIGSVGIPAKYGGFETLVEYLSKHLSSRVELTVYCSSKSYSVKVKKHNNARLRYIPLHANGVQSIPYDIFSIVHALFIADTLLILGVSGCCILPIVRLFTKKKIIVNIDGLEWKRNKWGKLTKGFLKYSEKLAVRYADAIIADNIEIQNHVKVTYGKDSVYIPYGGDHTKTVNFSKETLESYPFLKQEYAFKVCRIEPENNIEMILEAFSRKNSLQLVIVGNWENSEFGKTMRLKFDSLKHIHLLDPIYNQTTLNEIRCGCKVYIHGHSAGGTNPSLVEAMSLGLPVFAFAVKYNEETTAHQALFFKDSAQLVGLLEKHNELDLPFYGQKMQEIAAKEYVWSVIAEKYLVHV